MSAEICSQINCSTISMATLIFEGHEVLSFIFDCFKSLITNVL
jgi:hypothetical protein